MVEVLLRDPVVRHMNIHHPNNRVNGLLGPRSLRRIIKRIRENLSQAPELCEPGTILSGCVKRPSAGSLPPTPIL